MKSIYRTLLLLLATVVCTTTALADWRDDFQGMGIFNRSEGTKQRTVPKKRIDPVRIAPKRRTPARRYARPVVPRIDWEHYPGKIRKIVVSLKEQRAYILGHAGWVVQTPVSTGKRGHRTPTMITTVDYKERMHYSRLYNGAPMPHSFRLKGHIFGHGGDLPGYPASHGCVRLPYSIARAIFPKLKTRASGDATIVVIQREGYTRQLVLI